MLGLDPVFRAFLLAKHRQNPGLFETTDLDGNISRHSIGPLTDLNIDHYEQLIGARFNYQLLWNRNEVNEDSYIPGSEISLETYLSRVKNGLDDQIQQHMPHFSEVHDDWSARKRAVVEGDAKRAFKRIKLPKWVPPIFILPLLIILLLARPGMVDRSGSIGKLPMPDNLQKQHELTIEHIHILNDWDKGVTADDQKYLTSMANNHYETLKAIEAVLVARGDLWNEKNSKTKANKHYRMALGISKRLDELGNDEEIMRYTRKME